MTLHIMVASVIVRRVWIQPADKRSSTARDSVVIQDAAFRASLSLLQGV